MKKVILIISIISSYAMANGQDMPGMKMPKKETKAPEKKSEPAKQPEKVIYTCVMHPQIQKDKPGNCPICGMKLVKKTVKNAPAKIVAKKPDNMPIEPSGKMDMKGMPDKKEMEGMNMSNDKNKQPQQPVSYTCPMHPKIHSPKPGNCPICGMNLVKDKIGSV